MEFGMRLMKLRYQNNQTIVDSIDFVIFDVEIKMTKEAGCNSLVLAHNLIRGADSLNRIVQLRVDIENTIDETKI